MFVVDSVTVDTSQIVSLSVNDTHSIVFTKFGISDNVSMRWLSLENNTKFCVQYQVKNSPYFVYVKPQGTVSASLEYVPFVSGSKFSIFGINLFYLSHTNTTLAVRLELR